MQRSRPENTAFPALNCWVHHLQGSLSHGSQQRVLLRCRACVAIPPQSSHGQRPQFNHHSCGATSHGWLNHLHDGLVVRQRDKLGLSSSKTCDILSQLSFSIWLVPFLLYCDTDSAYFPVAFPQRHGLEIPPFSLYDGSL